MRRIEFHSHTSLSGDGTWAPLEMIRCAREMDHQVIALTDHVGVSNVEYVIEKLLEEREAARAWDGIDVLVGVEITHVPANQIAKTARRAREAGAEIILIHGETLAEPVEPGTNRAAVGCLDVDILAHPGLITDKEAQIAAQNNIHLEITARKDHSLTNGYVVQMARKVGAKLVLNTDAHQPTDLISMEKARKIALGATLSQSEVERVVTENMLLLYRSIRARVPA